MNSKEFFDMFRYNGFTIKANYRVTPASKSSGACVNKNIADYVISRHAGKWDLSLTGSISIGGSGNIITGKIVLPNKLQDVIGVTGHTWDNMCEKDVYLVMSYAYYLDDLRPR